MGWFRVDLEATPEYAVFDPEKPNQVIVGPFMSRPLNMKKIWDSDFGFAADSAATISF